MTHVCFTPPQPVLHGDCTPNLSPLLQLEQDPASPTAWERALARQGWGWHSHSGTKTGPFGGELLPLHPGTCSRTRCPVQAPGGERPRKTAAERSRRRLPFFSWIFLQCAAHSLGGKQRSVRGGGRRQPAGARRFQQGCLAAACINKPPGGRAAQKDENGAATGVI